MNNALTGRLHFRPQFFVDFGNFSYEKTGILTAQRRAWVVRRSFNLASPIITFVAWLPYGSPGFRDEWHRARSTRLASMMYTRSSLTANWMLIKPTVSKLAMRLVYS